MLITRSPVLPFGSNHFTRIILFWYITPYNIFNIHVSDSYIAMGLMIVLCITSFIAYFYKLTDFLSMEEEHNALCYRLKLLII